ncbi:hypothetical protein [Clostridioides sp. GD02404]|uniref:hypothetical protein n=1 Tax=Clostridioides sp. GD02404 TaxID=3054354 RepID=UPI00389DF452
MSLYFIINTEYKMMKPIATIAYTVNNMFSIVPFEITIHLYHIIGQKNNAKNLK